jgi:hypothetical protein
MGRLIAVLALAGAAAFAARPSSHANARLSSPESGPAAIARNADVAFVQAEKDLAGREAELGLVGAAPLFGAEGLPKPQR